MGSSEAGPTSIGPSIGETRCSSSFIQPVLHRTQTCGSTTLSASSLRTAPLRSSATALVPSLLPTQRGMTCSLLRLPTLPQNRKGPVAAPRVGGAGCSLGRPPSQVDSRSSGTVSLEPLAADPYRHRSQIKPHRLSLQKTYIPAAHLRRSVCSSWSEHQDRRPQVLCQGRQLVGAVRNDPAEHDLVDATDDRLRR
jgi:hypothetical protein